MFSVINCGTTTIADWCHNCLTPAHADAAIDALIVAGIRAVFFHGTPHGGPTKPHDVSEVDRLLSGPVANSALLTAGMAIKGPQLSASDVAIADLRAALERGVIASMHQSAGTPGHGWNAVEFHRTGMGAPTAGLTSRQALSWATVHGARVLGLADKVGHLSPGMQADIVVIDARALNLWPAHDPVTAALQASIANIEAVMIAGRWRKRHHTLVDADVDDVKDRLQQSGERFAHQIRATGPLARTRRRVVRTVVRRHLRRQTRSAS